MMLRMKRLVSFCWSALLLLALCGSSSLSAQWLQPVVPDTLPIVRFEADTLYIAQDTTYLYGFYSQLAEVARTGQGSVSILHIGGSHVQGGTMSNRIRRNILSNFPDAVGSRGMIFPYSAANKCNNPADYRVKRTVTFDLVRNVYKVHDKRLGACGIAVYSSDSNAAITIRMNDTIFQYGTTRITLLGYPNDTVEVLPTLVVDGMEYISEDYSSVNRRYVFELPAPVDSFTLKLNCHDGGDFTVTGLLLESAKPGVTFHSIGVNGAATDSYLRCADFVEDMELVHPDLVIFGIGINDASGPNFDKEVFIRNYLRLVAEFREVNPDCAFIFLTNNDSYKGSGKRAHANPNGKLVQEACYRLADEVGGAVWDQFAIMGGLGSMQKWRAAGYAQSDRVHFTVKGYNLVGDLFYNAFANGMERVLKP